MPFVITSAEEEVEPQVSQEEEGPGVESNPPKGNGAFVVTSAEDEPETSYLRGFGGAAQDFFAKALDMGVRMLGGGPNSPMVRHERWKKEGEPVLRQMLEEMNLREQGLTDEAIAEKLGPAPEPEKLVESFVELGDIITGGRLIPRTATERTIRQAGGTAGEFATIGALMPGGATLPRLAKEARTGALFGTGEQAAEEAGFGEAGKLTSGVLVGSLPFLLKKGVQGISKGIEFGKGLLGGKKLPAGEPAFLAETGERALADLELSQRDLTGRVAKTSESMLNQFQETVTKVAEPSFKDVGTFRAADIESEIVKANQNTILDSISPVADTKKKSWEAVQNVVNDNFNAVRETYRRLYEFSEEAAKGITIEPVKTFERAKGLRDEMRGSLLEVAQETGVLSPVNRLISRLIPSQEKTAVKLIEDLSKEGILADYEEVVSMLTQEAERGAPRAIPVDRLMKTKRSINRILEKSDIIPAPVDLLKPISAALKEDILKGLEKNDFARRAYTAAENQFAEAQRVFNNEEIVKLRKSQVPEDLITAFAKPSNIEKLNEAIGKSPKVKDLIDRLIVENISKKGTDLAREMATESRAYIGEKANKALDRILEYGDKLTTPGQLSLARGNVLQDLQKATTTGARPDFTLKLMRTPVGYNLVKGTLERSPKGRQMMKGLQRLTVEEMVESVIGKDKQIDFQKTKDILSDPHLKSIVKETLGEEGMRFFSQLEQYGKNMAENLHHFAMRDRSLFDKAVDTYLDKGLKYVFYAAAPFTMGKSLLPLLGAETAARAHRARLFRILENPQAREAIRDMGQKNQSHQRMAALMKRLAQVSGRSQEE